MFAVILNTGRKVGLLIYAHSVRGIADMKKSFMSAQMNARRNF
jgi:hypothetical protein